jgi:hypothetical protein
MQLIVDMMKDNSPADAIETALESRFGVPVDDRKPTAEEQQQVATTQQQLLDPVLFLNVISQQTAEVALLRKEIEELRNQLEGREDSREEREEARDRQLIEVMRMLQEEKKKPWWKRIF